MVRKSSETLMCVLLTIHLKILHYVEWGKCATWRIARFSVLMCGRNFLIVGFVGFWSFVSFILFWFSTGCSLKKLLQVKLAMIASAVYSLLYRTKYDSGACWHCSQFGKTYSEYFVHGCVVLLVFQHAYLRCPMLCVDICYIQDGHYAKAQKLSMTISVAVKEKQKRELCS